MKAELILGGKYLFNPSDEDVEVIKYYEGVVDKINSGDMTLKGFCTPVYTAQESKPLQIVVSRD